MLDRLAQQVDRLSTRRHFFLLLIATLITLLIVNLIDLPWTLPAFKRLTNGLNILDMEFHYSAAHAYAMLNGYGSAGRALYLHILWPVDVFIPLVVSSFLAVAITMAWRKDAAQRPWMRYLFLLGVLAGLFDYAENMSITVLLLSYPRRLEGVANFAGYMTSTKHVMYQVALWAAVIGGGRTWMRGR